MTVTDAFFLVLNFLVGPFMFIAYGFGLLLVAIELNIFWGIERWSYDHPFAFASIRWVMGILGSLIALTCLFYVAGTSEFVTWRF